MLRVRGHEDHRRAVALRDQQALQLDTAHPGHLYVRDQAGRVVDAARPQKILGRRKRARAITERSQQSLRCVTNRLVIVDD